jgi:flavin reductase (DIM6/NTAB) family NADH-FMN oxidoreductase RutF
MHRETKDAKFEVCTPDPGFSLDVLHAPTQSQNLAHKSSPQTVSPMKLPEINQLLRSIDRELWVVTAAFEGQTGGLVATFVSPISIVPELPRMAVAIDKQHHTWNLIEASGSFAVHLLSQEQFDLAWHFGSQSGHEVDKFGPLEWAPGETGSPILKAAAGWLECRIEARLDTGDRTMYLAEVVAGDLSHAFTPLTQKQFLSSTSPDQLSKLKSSMSQDSIADAEAILAWRKMQ